MKLKTKDKTIELNERTARALTLVVKYRNLMKEIKRFCGEQAGEDDYSAMAALRSIASDGITEAAGREPF